MNNFINNFWHGKISLWKSYWIIGELFNAIFFLMIINLEIRFLNNSNLLQYLPFYSFADLSIISKLMLILWTTFITVGIWRSAEAYKGKLIWIILTLIILSYRIFSLRLIFY